MTAATVYADKFFEPTVPSSNPSGFVHPTPDKIHETDVEPLVQNPFYLPPNLNPEELEFQNRRTAFEELQYHRTKQALIDLIYKFGTEDLSIREFDEDVVNKEAVDAAIKFLWALPSDYQLPRVAPDEDGILMVWDTPEKATVLTFVDNEIHAVDHAGSLTSQHIPPQKFEGTRIPFEISSCLPHQD